MNPTTLIILTLLLLQASADGCNGVSDCFLKTLFDFSYPE
jgi:hypothetical protein